MDLASTSLGLQRPGTSEKNVFATDAAGVYVPLRAWLLTLAGAVIMVACILFSARNSASVEHRWLKHPIRSFKNQYLNPWSKSALTVSPLHMLSLVLAFTFLRILASANNVLVYYYGWGPMGELIKWVSTRTSPLAGFCLVVFSCFIATIFVMAPLAATILESWKRAAVHK